MKKHKWADEIIYWANGGEVESKFLHQKTWYINDTPDWNNEEFEFRIKLQPKEPQCKKHKDAPHGFCRDASASEDRYVCECEYWEEPKEQQYLYASYHPQNSSIRLLDYEDKNSYYIGKIKLEVDE